MEQRGTGQALIAAVLGVVLVLAGPCVLAAAGSAWERIVLLSLVLASAALLVAAFVLALVGQICESRGASVGNRLRMLADIFLIAAVGAFFIVAVFSFVLAVIGISAGML